MTKREIVNEILEGLKTDPRDIEKICKAKKDLLERWLQEYHRVKKHPEVLKDANVRTWQITARWMLLR